jgi:hypothetical protein
VKDNDWVAQVNRSMEGIENREILIAKETDTSEMSDLRNCFVRYLTHAQGRSPHLVYAGHVYHGDGRYFFTHNGFKNYLRAENLTVGRTNLREWLIAQGCAESKVEWETGRGVKRTIPCWEKPETEELLSMGEFYEDVYAGDEDVLRKGHPAESGAEGQGDVRF